jgi:hypothetical protein
MKIGFSASMMLAIAGWQTASAVEVSWYRQPGSALHISSNASASPWIIGMDNNVYKWDANSKQFVNQNYSATRVAVTTRDDLWIVDEFGVRPQGGLVGSTKAREVAVGGNNSAWIIGTDVRAGGYGVYQASVGSLFTNYNYANFGAVRLAVDKVGNAWVVNDTGEIHMYNLASKTWERIPANGYSSTTKARSIHTGGSSGAVWMLTTQPIPGGFPIFQWNASTRAWEPFGSYGAVDVTEAAGVPWIVQSDGRLYSQAQPTTTAPSAPINLTQPWPPPTAQLLAPFRAPTKGTVLCTTVGSTNDCDENTKADYVGKYALDTTCDEGFYDMIYGGSCWECDPGYDGRGAFIRSLTRVDSDDACWRVPKETTSRANLVKAPALAWDCPSGSFWDGYSPNGCCGSCWTCPADNPRRTAAPIWESNACASSLNETKRATFLSFNGCPKPDPADMNLPGKRLPGKPFLDIAAGATQASSDGVCFACPVSDSEGNFLISDRNGNPLYDKDTNTGCTIKMKWQPATFYEPGLGYMQGVKDLIWERRLFDGARITGFLYDQAEALGLGDATPEAKEWVKARWEEIARNPYNNDQFRAYIFILLKDALAKEAANRTGAEKNLIKSFESYIQQRHTYLAEQALAMYDAWKTSDDLFRANTGQNKSWAALFYYGTVPLDFQGTLSGLIGVGGLGGGVLSAMVTMNQYVRGIELIDDIDDIEAGLEKPAKIVNTRTTLHGILKSLKALKTVQGLKAVSGPGVVAVALEILASIAIDQFIAIETARPNLLAALDLAKKPVNLDVLAASANGEDIMYLFWAKAMEATDQEDAQVQQLAAVAQVRAEQSGYAAPPKEYHLLPPALDTLYSDGTLGYLNQSEKLISKNGKYQAEMQADGNFVIYAPNRVAIWSSGTNGRGTAPYKLVMQADGNLVIYGANGFVWNSGTQGSAAPYRLVMQDDANLCIYDSKNNFVWNSGSYRAP